MFPPSSARLTSKETRKFTADHSRFASEVKSGSAMSFSADAGSHQVKIAE
jgi:hypothetical protein